VSIPAHHEPLSSSNPTNRQVLFTDLPGAAPEPYEDPFASGLPDYRRVRVLIAGIGVGCGSLLTTAAQLIPILYEGWAEYPLPAAGWLEIIPSETCAECQALADACRIDRLSWPLSRVLRVEWLPDRQDEYGEDCCDEELFAEVMAHVPEAAVELRTRTTAIHHTRRNNR
jgi:hypothetical protein